MYVQSVLVESNGFMKCVINFVRVHIWRSGQLAALAFLHSPYEYRQGPRNQTQVISLGGIFTC